MRLASRGSAHPKDERPPLQSLLGFGQRSKFEGLCTACEGTARAASQGSGDLAQLRRARIADERLECTKPTRDAAARMQHPPERTSTRPRCKLRPFGISHCEICLPRYRSATPEFQATAYFALHVRCLRIRVFCRASVVLGRIVRVLDYVGDVQQAAAWLRAEHHCTTGQRAPRWQNF